MGATSANSVPAAASAPSTSTTRPELHFDPSGHIILDAPAAAFASAYGTKFLYAGLPESTPYPPVPDTHHDFRIV
jgi:hypothetical protein